MGADWSGAKWLSHGVTVVSFPVTISTHLAESNAVQGRHKRGGSIPSNKLAWPANRRAAGHVKPPFSTLYKW